MPKKSELQPVKARLCQGSFTRRIPNAASRGWVSLGLRQIGDAGFLGLGFRVWGSGFRVFRLGTQTNRSSRRRVHLRASDVIEPFSGSGRRSTITDPRIQLCYYRPAFDAYVDS